MISAIILAAGPSTRMGFFKLLAKIGSKNIVEHVVDAALNSTVDEVILVLGHMAERITISKNDSRLRVVINKDYMTGLSTSVKAGINALSKNSEAAIFMLGDQPLIKPSTLNKLAEAYRITGDLLIAPFYQGVRGNPILVDKKFFRELKRISGDVGGRILLAKLADHILKVEVDDIGILLDVDNSNDLRTIRDKMQ